jgi:hypothetical protein
VSSGELVLLLVLSVVWAMLGYRLSENDKARLGRTPWGWPSALWALFWFLSLALGLVLYLIAHSNGVRKAQQQPGGMFPPQPATPTVGRPQLPKRQPTVSEQFPAYPRPANVHSEPAGVEGPVPAHTTWPGTPPDWYADPSGRFHHRWWNGYEWTSEVSLDGQHLIDTNPDQRIGPY